MEALNYSAIEAAGLQLAPLLAKPKNDAEHQQLLDAIHYLLDQHDFDSESEHPLGGLLVVLSNLAESYEQEHWEPLDEDIHPGELLKYFMELKGITQIELEALGFDKQSRISRLINKKSNMTLDHIKKAALIFDVDPKVFL